MAYTPRYTPGTEWGRYVKETDPTRNFTDAFLENFKESMAYRLAQEEKKRQEQRQARERKALEDYRQVQMEVQQAQERAEYMETMRHHKEMEKPKEPTAKDELAEYVAGLELAVTKGTATDEQKKQWEELQQIDQKSDMTPYQKAQLALQWWKAHKQYEEEPEEPEEPMGKPRGLWQPEGNIKQTGIKRIKELQKAIPTLTTKEQNAAAKEIQDIANQLSISDEELEKIMTQ
uniref:Uncharacterized protein n=1 Tax=viral metagenome TaxID=1070528 RepID=A0A6M3KIJ3_9ZZZZ